MNIQIDWNFRYAKNLKAKRNITENILREKKNTHKHT